jgi:hypothetical protein
LSSVPWGILAGLAACLLSDYAAAGGYASAGMAMIRGAERCRG